MGRPKDLYSIDVVKFRATLKREAKEMALVARIRAMRNVISNLKAIDYHTYDVKYAGGYVTSDKERSGTLKAAVKLRENIIVTDEMVRTSFHVEGMDSTDAFIGYYYEFGTGSKFQKPEKQRFVNIATEVYESYEENPSRSGKGIVTRPKGLWTDLSGNMRTGGSNRVKPKSIPYYEVDAYEWYQSVLKDVESEWAIHSKRLSKRIPRMIKECMRR